jgi:hypothetical protein
MDRGFGKFYFLESTVSIKCYCKISHEYYGEMPIWSWVDDPLITLGKKVSERYDRCDFSYNVEFSIIHIRICASLNFEFSGILSIELMLWIRLITICSFDILKNSGCD